MAEEGEGKANLMGDTSAQLPPPPGQDGSVPVRGEGSGSGFDQFRGFLTKLTGGGMPMVQKQLEDAHQQRVAQASMNAKTYQDINKLLTLDPDKKYHDPQGNLTPAGQQLEMQRQQAYQAWLKAAGVNKQSKSIIQKVGQVADHLVHHRKGGPPQGEQPGGGSQERMSAPPVQLAGPSSKGMPAPPVMLDGDSSAAPAGGPGAASAGASPSAATSIPAPPSPPSGVPAAFDSGEALAMAQEDHKNQMALDLYNKEHPLSTTKAKLKDVEEGLGRPLTDDEKRQYLKLEAKERPSKVVYNDPDNPGYNLFGTYAGGVVYDQNMQPVPNAKQVMPSMLPTAHTGEMPVFNPVTNRFEPQPTYSSSRKVAPKASGAKGKASALPGPPATASGGPASADGASKSPTASATPVAGGGDRHGIPARQFNILQKQATSINEARNSLIGDNPEKIEGLAGDLDVFKRPASVKRLSEYLGLVASTVENEAKQVTGQGPLAAAEWYLQLPQTVVELQQGALADASRGLDDGAPDGPEHRFVADYFRNMGTIGGLRASTGASAAKWSFNTLRSEMPTPGPVTSYEEAKRRVRNILQETNVVAKLNPLTKAIDPSRLDALDVIYARDPNGVLHKATKGTSVPKGWKLDASR